MFLVNVQSNVNHGRNYIMIGLREAARGKALFPELKRVRSFFFSEGSLTCNWT